MYSCQGCGQSNPSCFEYAYGHGDLLSYNVVCTACGVVQSDVTAVNIVAQNPGNSGNDREDSTTKHKKRQTHYLGTYLRRIHLKERLYAHNRAEPQVPDDDMEIIQAAHLELYDKDPLYRWEVDNECLNKKTIQKLLRFVNSKYEDKKDQRFCKLYLEVNDCYYCYYYVYYV